MANNENNENKNKILKQIDKKHKKSTNSINHYHHGHRKRKREQFLKSDINSVPEHEIIEFLLFFSIPRGDTNLIAHLLVNKFGSLVNIINASYEELLTVEGIGPRSAELICFSKKLIEFYTKSKLDVNLIESFTPEFASEFCKSLFTDSTKEHLYCLYLTDDLKLVGYEKVASGSFSNLKIPFRKIAKSTISKNCSNLILAHNHPRGTCIPSRRDIESTNSIRNLCSKIEVKLIDHIIIGIDGEISLKERGFLE